MSYSKIDFGSDTEMTWDDNGIHGRRSILPGGLRVLTEHIPGQHSAAVSFWIGAGSRDETAGHEGSTHFLEHLLFKGTPTRSAVQISEESDFIGSGLNAATARTSTDYHGRVFSEDLPTLVDLLADMITSPRLDAKDMELERGVILEELSSSDDDAEDVAANAMLLSVMGDHPVARPIGGTQEIVSALAHSSMREHYRDYYKPSELVITAAGDVDHDELCALAVDRLTAGGWDLTGEAKSADRRRYPKVTYSEATVEHREHPSQQAQVSVGMPGLAVADDDEFAAYSLALILGGGASSRLFQEVRERRGLAYSAYAWSMLAEEGGLFAMDAACAPEKAEEVARIMGECLDDIAANGVTQREVDSAFNQRRTALTFRMETNTFRRNRLGRSELGRGELFSVEEQLRLAREVTAEDIRRVAQRLASGPRSMVFVGA